MPIYNSGSGDLLLLYIAVQCYFKKIEVNFDVQTDTVRLL